MLRPISAKNPKKYNIIGFDVETKGENNDFDFGGFYFFNKKFCKSKNVYLDYIMFDKREDMIDFFISHTKFFSGSFIVATNLSFDFHALFFNNSSYNNFNIIFRGSDIIQATFKDKNSKHKGKINFIDTFNFIQSSVESLGHSIGIEKQKHPEFFLKKHLGQLNKEEREEYINYNKQDCKISAGWIDFFQNFLLEHGGKLKNTISNCALYLWRRKFLNTILLKEKDVLQKPEIKDFIMNAYYGGRTEVYKRGEFKDVFVYDVNSLYPYVMREEYPLPNSVIEVKKDFNNYLNMFGVSEVEMLCPDNVFPILPLREENKKLIFPIGNIKGTFTNHEIVFAINQGYILNKINKMIVYEKTFYPFKEYVDTLYNLRLKFQAEKNINEQACKLLLNSLYGKFAQKKLDRTEIKIIDSIDNSELLKKFKKAKDVFFSKDKKICMIKTESNYEPNFNYPIFSVYTTAKARIHMYNFIKQNDVLYTDTDSIFTSTNRNINDKHIGGFKLEKEFSFLRLDKPKMYYGELKEEYIKNDVKMLIKVKGLNRATEENYKDILKGLPITKRRIVKIKEMIHDRNNNKKVLEWRNIEKLFNIDDNKRLWSGNNSFPIRINNSEV